MTTTYWGSKSDGYYGDRKNYSDYGERKSYYYDDHCGGAMRVSGKGAGPRHGPKTRHQKVMAFPAWGGKNGTDVYLSSRWDNDWQIYDHFHSAKSIDVANRALGLGLCPGSPLQFKNR